MSFNFSRKHAFPPEFHVGTEMLEVKPVIKILGVMLQNDLKWGTQIDYITRKASKTIWRLQKMIQLGVDATTLALFWKK